MSNNLRKNDQIQNAARSSKEVGVSGWESWTGVDAQRTFELGRRDRRARADLSEETCGERSL